MKRWINHRGDPDRGRRSANSPGLTLVDGVDVAGGLVVAGLSVIAVLGYHEVFQQWRFLVPATVGSVGALAVGIAGRAMGRRSGTVVLGSLLALAVVGTVTTQGLPGPSAIATFVDGLIGGWVDILSTLPPVPLTSDLAVLPFVSAWLGTLVGVELLRNRRLPGLAGVGPVLVFVLTILMTFESRLFALVQGAVTMAGLLVVAFLQQRRALLPIEPTSAETIGGSQRIGGIVKTMAVTTAVAAMATVLAPRVPFAATNDRFDLRDHQTPPFDPLREPTPLVQVKAALQEKNAERVVFTVTATEPIDRFPVAILDHYTNEFWSVVADTSDAPAQFLPVGSGFPVPDDSTVEGWARQAASIEIKDLDRLSGGDFDQPWLPGIGWPVSISSSTALDLRFNPGTGTVAVAPDGPSAGTVYTIEALVPPAVEDVALADAVISTVEPFDLAVPQLQTFADDTLEGTNGGWDAVEAIRARLAGSGAYDSREASPTARSGHSLGRLAEFVAGGGQTVGFEEQYAATAALIARSAGLPARVVVGFVISPEESESRWANGNARRSRR